MTTEYKLNQLIKWTEEDRAKGVCPVPAGSDVTLWLSDRGACRDCCPQYYGWGSADSIITAYLIHSLPREPIVGWLVVVSGANSCWYETKDAAERIVSEYGGRVVKLVEEME